MKALSIHPVPTMEIFMGWKRVEYRSWRTDYRGDLLICATAANQSGFVSRHAFFTVPLLDVRCEDEYADESGRRARVYEWILGQPKAIKPIRVRGQLFLFEVEDQRIEYVEGGDLGLYSSDAQRDRFRRRYMKEYLEPVGYCDEVACCDPDYYPNETEEKYPFRDFDYGRKKREDLKQVTVEDVMDEILYLDPYLPLTAEAGMKLYGIDHTRPDRFLWKTRLLCRLALQDGTLPFGSVYGSVDAMFKLWLAEALGEDSEALKAAVAAMERAASEPEDRNDAFDGVIPFERVFELLNRPMAWHLDPAVSIVLDFTEKQRRPFVQRGCSTDFARLLKKEKIYLL